MGLDTHELAWAAGFFDGEGGTYIAVNKRGRKRENLHVSVRVAQVHRAPLDRFHAAVCDLGYVYGPYKNKRKNHQPCYMFMATCFEHAQAIIAFLWKYLGAVKRQQAAKALTALHAYHALPRLPRGLTSKRSR